jgi:hypothetical protein
MICRDRPITAHVGLWRALFFVAVMGRFFRLRPEAGQDGGDPLEMGAQSPPCAARADNPAMRCAQYRTLPINNYIIGDNRLTVASGGSCPISAGTHEAKTRPEMASCDIGRVYK